MSLRTLWMVCLVVGTSGLTMPAAGDPGKAFSFRGLEPGGTTAEQLQANTRWGEPKKKEAGEEGAELWYYQPRGYREAVITVRSGLVQTIDIHLPRNISVEDAAAALKLGIPLESESLPAAAKIGVTIPSNWEAIPYSAGRVLLYADSQSNHALLVRSFAAEILGLPKADPAPGTPTNSPVVSDSLPAKPSALRGQTQASREIVEGVAKILPHYHISKHPLDDDIGERTLSLFLDQLDPFRLYFTQQDINLFRRQVDQVDDRLQRGDLSLAYKVFRTYLTRLTERHELVEQLLDNDYDFSLDEEWVILNQDEPWAENDIEIREVWRKRVKYQLLVHLEAGSDLEEAKRKFSRTLRSEADEQALVDDNDLLAHFLSRVFNAYDPRSTYYSPMLWENSQIRTAGEMVGIGANLKITDGYVEVVNIVTGSPSHKDGRLKKGDRIVAIGQGHDSEMVEAAGKKLADIIQLIRGTEDSFVRLRVLPLGAFETSLIDIKRAKFKLLKTGSMVLSEKEHGRPGASRIGYIRLPTIYADMAASDADKKDSHSAMHDMRRALIDLKDQKVDVLLLDLRDNPGGSFNEAMNIAGLFVGTGAVTQVGDGTEKTVAYSPQLEPTDVIWGQPLVVLTNKSTSGGPEIIAAAVQDYHRGIVLGDSYTNGNGVNAYQNYVTGLLGIEKEEQTEEDRRRMGVAQLVQHKFYRVNGDGFQARGVLPDVTLPSLSEALHTTQSDLPYALSFNRVKPVPFTVANNPLDSDDIDRIKKWSASRLAKSDYFQAFEPRLAKFRERRGKQVYALNRDRYRAAQLEEQEATEQAPALEDVPDVLLDSYLKECMAVALDYAGEHHLATAEKSLKEHRYQTALDSYRRAVAANPQRKHARYKLAWSLGTLPSSQYRNGKEAVEHARQLCEMDERQDWSYLLTLAIAEAEAGNFEKAKEELSAALEKAPAKQRSQYDYLKSRFDNRRTYAN